MQEVPPLRILPKEHGKKKNNLNRKQGENLVNWTSRSGDGPFKLLSGGIVGNHFLHDFSPRDYVLFLTFVSYFVCIFSALF